MEHVGLLSKGGLAKKCVYLLLLWSILVYFAFCQQTLGDPRCCIA